MIEESLLLEEIFSFSEATSSKNIKLEELREERIIRSLADSVTRSYSNNLAQKVSIKGISTCQCSKCSLKEELFVCLKIFDDRLKLYFKPNFSRTLLKNYKALPLVSLSSEIAFSYTVVREIAKGSLYQNQRILLEDFGREKRINTGKRIFILDIAIGNELFQEALVIELDDYLKERIRAI